MTKRRPPQNPHAGPGSDRRTGGQRDRQGGAKSVGAGEPAREHRGSASPERPSGQPRHQHRGRSAHGRASTGGSAAGSSAAGRVWIFGIHAVEAALRNPARRIVSLRLSDNANQRLAAAIAARGLSPQSCEPREIDRLIGADAVHQGALLETNELPMPDVRDLAELAKTDLTAGRPGLVIVLDQVTDPHNVGAVLRSAAVFGASGLIMTARNSPPLDGTLAKAASGGLDHVPIALVPNLARALDQLADGGVWRIGLDGEAAQALEDYRDEGPAALVLGAEERGLRRLTQENCDLICRLTTAGAMRSLNVSNAAAIAMHTLAMRRR